MSKEDYIPFGEEWGKELMKCSKKDLIDLYRRQILYSNQQCEEKDKRIKELEDGLRKINGMVKSRYSMESIDTVVKQLLTSKH